MRIRHLSPALTLHLIVFLSMVVAISACKNERLTTIHASIVAVDTARDEFVKWDLDHQHGLIDESKAHGETRDQAAAKLDAYVLKRQVVVDGFRIVYRALALASTQTDELSLTAAKVEIAKLLESILTLRGDISAATPKKGT